jgi:hypothetical protein
MNNCSYSQWWGTVLTLRLFQDQKNLRNRSSEALAGVGDAAAMTNYFAYDRNWTPPRSLRHAKDLCMATCEVCENEYDKAFEVVVGGQRHTFDSFECAIHALAPVCPHCNCRIVGHGVEADGKIFCCVHCARASGTTQLKDRA